MKNKRLKEINLLAEEELKLGNGRAYASLSSDFAYVMQKQKSIKFYNNN